MMLGGWESLDMVVRYTRSVKFEESLRVMRGLGKYGFKIVYFLPQLFKLKLFLFKQLYADIDYLFIIQNAFIPRYFF